jgi:hypothetical protein
MRSGVYLSRRLVRVVTKFRDGAEEKAIREIVDALIRGLQIASGVNRAGACVMVRGKRGIVERAQGKHTPTRSHQVKHRGVEWSPSPSACKIRPAYFWHFAQGWRPALISRLVVSYRWAQSSSERFSFHYVLVKLDAVQIDAIQQQNKAEAKRRLYRYAMLMQILIKLGNIQSTWITVLT